jgi:hypothetical protein
VRWRQVGCILVGTSLTLLGCQKEGAGGSASGAGQVAAAPAPAATEVRPPMAFLDSPAENGVAGSSASVVGWALDESGIAQVIVAVDSQNPTNAALGLPHPGVADAHPGIAGNDRAGFSIEIPGLSTGSHSLSVTVLAKSGGRTEIHRSFEVR